MRKIAILFLVLFASLFVRGQEMWGVVGTNYSGSNSALLNPALMHGSKLYMDINLLTADMFAESNYLFIPREDYRPGLYLQEGAELPTYGRKNQSFDHYTEERRYSAYSNIFAKGPSAMLVYNQHAFGIHTAGRTVVSGNQLPYDITNFAYESLDYYPQWNVNYLDDDLSFGAMAWGEIGLSYANLFYKYGFDQWSAGLTVKYLMGFSGAYLRVDNLDYLVLNDSTVDIRNMDAEAGFALPIGLNNNDFPDGPNFKGSGVGLDLGITYTRMRQGHSNRKYRQLCKQPHKDYIYRIGFSILDLGGISFKNNAQKHAYDGVSHYWPQIDTLTYSNVNNLAAELSNRFYGDPTASLLAEQMRMSLPTALSLQFDYHYFENWYIGGAFIYPIMFSNSYLKRPAQIAAIPRYESRHFELSVPLSLYEFTKPRIGLAARVYFITVGTDKLGSYLGMSDFTGADLYFSIKINFGKGFCGKQMGATCDGSVYGNY